MQLIVKQFNEQNVTALQHARSIRLPGSEMESQMRAENHQRAGFVENLQKTEKHPKGCFSY
jgi:hypothetical protein